MNFKELRTTVKAELKVRATELRELKKARKPSVYKTMDINHSRSDLPLLIDDRKWQFRNKHIAYCEFFNRTSREMIEQKFNEEPSECVIDKYKEKWTEIMEAERDAEAVHCG